MKWNDELKEELEAHLSVYSWNELLDIHEKMHNDHEIMNLLKYKPSLLTVSPSELAEHLFFEYN